MYDLHVHSTASDGKLTPRELVKAAVEIGLTGFALTDHDTVDGLNEAAAYIRENNIPLDFIPGIELNTDYKGQEIHILGYFIDYQQDELSHRLLELKDQRLQRAAKMVNKLRDLNIDINFLEVLQESRGDVIARPHIGRVLMAKGYANSMKEAFDTYIGRGKPGYVSRYKISPREAMAIIKNCHGLTVLAHPGLAGDDELVAEVIAMGIEGLEVFYPEHSQKQTEYYKMMAEKRGLLITGGSDFHGSESGEKRSLLGLAGISDKFMEQIIAYRRLNLTT